jgi:hypothetical protein
MARQSRALPWAVLLLLLNAPLAQAAEPYSVRGITLGILLADFKIAPALDQDRWPGSHALCSDDRPAATPSKAIADELALTAAEVKAGIVRCAFAHLATGTLEPAGPVIAGTAAQVGFVFVPDRKGELRLAAVRAEGVSEDYDKVKLALAKRYGPPQAVVRGFAYDAAGAKLTDETARWSNGVSQIEIDQRLEDQDVNHMAIEYRHEALIGEAKQRLKAAGAAREDFL